MKQLHYILAAAVTSSMANADPASDDLFSLSLEDLSNINISTVSKKNELALQAPGVVTVITAAEIKMFGATSIKDVLLRIPNFYIFDSSTFSASGVTMRAGATQHLNNHVLYLINGRPLRESQNGGLHTDINLLVPVTALESIEVIRGPGSVLYGTNAFSGTVNFIIRKPKDDNQVQLNLTAGSDSYVRTGASLQAPIGEYGGISVHVSDLNSDGETISAVDEAGTTDSLDLYRDGQSLLVDSYYGGFTFNAIINEIATPLSSGAFRWSNIAELELKREFYDLGYEHSLSKDWSIGVNYTYNQLDRYIERPTGPSSEFLANGYLYEITVKGAINNHSSIVMGAVVDQLRGDLGPSGGSYSNKRTGVYGQLDYQLQAATKLSIGAQWNDPEDEEARTSPRLGIIHTWSSSWSSKILYSEAFRSPYGSELYFDAGFLQGDPHLKPETIATTEVQSTYTASDFYLAMTYYHSNTENSIGRAIVNGTNTAVNEDSKISFDGFELEGKWTISNTWQFQGSYHYQINEDDNGQQDFMPAARTMTKIGLAYQSPKGYQMGLWNSYFGKASKLENLEGNNTAVVNPDADAFNLLSINLRANIGRVLDNSQWKNIELAIYANNLLDEEVYYPELGRRLVNTYPQSHAQGVFADLSIKF
ncbi:TonB-dependent siderophore receptor [Oceanicoccus sp. KOV_DT_Chl]|uniref:TonB-dependent receptor plug domain-containing protein n=1 Tax=Oceanicoccus sp. KOV_DT_Chl TaxID=1904639 RepID=UPI000C7A6E9F|nr:TonB-dependent receptor [Oceanicoccus sp. KOV_DT_Chl]